MSAPVGQDLSGIIKWCAREEWRPHVDAVMAEHFEPAIEAFRMTFEAIGDALGGSWDMTLWGCAFEDFLTRRFGPNDENPVEAYLRRRGWKERVTTRAYMTALQTSVMSLYEVSDIVLGQSLRARDLVRGGEPVLVNERTATRTLKTWDRIAARIVEQNGKSVLAGGVLAFTVEASEGLFSRLRDHVADTGTKRRGGTGKARALKGWRGSEVDLRRAAPLFTAAWLFDVLPRALRTDSPKLFNSDGDEIVFHTVTFPLVASASANAIEARLNQLIDLHQASPTFWNWLGGRRGNGMMAKTPKGVTFNSTMDDGSPVLGTVELNERFVLLEASSRARADRGTAMVATALAGLVAPPLTEIQTIEQVKAAPRPKRESSAAAIPQQVQEQLVHEVLDRHYRALLDEPVPMLGDISPRKATRSAHGREKLVTWLKQLENGSNRAGEPNTPMATYDFNWLWRELNVEHLRT
jgi:hypothetical protein